MKYKVLKPFINQLGNVFNPEEYYSPPSDNWSPFVSGLIQHGFIEEIKDEPWKPKVDIDTYYTIEFDNEVDAHIWSDSEIDKSYMKIGNCFQTKVQAEDAIEWLKAFKVLRDDTHGFKPDWKDDGTYKYSVAYSYHRQDLYVRWDKWERDGLIYFATVPDAEESIKTHSHEWKVFLGIEEEE